MKDEFRALAHVQKEIEKTRQEQIEFLAAARAESFNDYAKICGVIRGLARAQQEVQDLAKNFMDQDDD